MRLRRGVFGQKKIRSDFQVVDEKEIAELHEIAKGSDARMDERHELLHERVIEAPLIEPIPELVIRNRFDDVFLIDPF